MPRTATIVRVDGGGAIYSWNDVCVLGLASPFPAVKSFKRGKAPHVEGAVDGSARYAPEARFA